MISCKKLIDHAFQLLSFVMSLNLQNRFRQKHTHKTISTILPLLSLTASISAPRSTLPRQPRAHAFPPVPHQIRHASSPRHEPCSSSSSHLRQSHNFPNSISQQRTLSPPLHSGSLGQDSNASSHRSTPPRCLCTGPAILRPRQLCGWFSRRHVCTSSPSFPRGRDRCDIYCVWHR